MFATSSCPHISKRSAIPISDMELTDHQKRLAGMFWLIVDYCLANAGNSALKGMDRHNLFKYVAFCFFTGRLNVAWEAGKIEAVVFAWPGTRVEIEARSQVSQGSFKWELPRRGDCLFVADVIGSRNGVAKIYHGQVEKNPQLNFIPILTYRHGRLHRLKHLNRFLRGRK